MDKIRIYKKDNVNYIELPKTRRINYLDKILAHEATMASGRIVQDIVGYRPTISIELEYVPPVIMVELVQMIRQGGFFKVEYPSPCGKVEVGVFKLFEKSGQKIFKFTNGVPLWYGVELELTAQVVREA